MKKKLSMVFGILVIIVVYAFYNDVQNKKYLRFKAMVTLKVVDQDGLPVENVNIDAAFGNQTRKAPDMQRMTDENGYCAIKGESDSALYYNVTKEGYYKSSSKYSVSSSLKRKKYKRLKYAPWIIRWSPWNPIVKVVLKKVRNPIAMQARKAEMTLPGLEKYYPFDLDICDWVEPYGKGQEANIYIYYYYKTSDMFTGKTILRIKTADRYTGLQIAELDEYSKFESMYFALTNNYTNLIDFVVDRNKTEVFKNTRLKENQYLIFKVQNSTNSTMYNYGKIYQPFEYGRDRDSNTYGLEFTYYYNPTPNDRNLEFDPKKNLIKTVDFRGKDNSDRFDP
jgi:hypothetical protein